MVLAPGMRTRFEALASYEVDNLVKVEFEKRATMFGYLRLVDGNSFVLDEVARDEGKIVITQETTVDIHQAKEYSKLPPDSPEVPGRYMTFGTV